MSDLEDSIGMMICLLNRRKQGTGEGRHKEGDGRENKERENERTTK